MMDFAAARASMINSQVRPNDVIDPRVIAAMSEVAREAFVPDEMRDHAYVDADLFIGVDEKGRARHLLAPMTQARMLQAAGIDREDCVLDVACASGCSTALLAHMAQSVIAVEESPSLAARAAELLEGQGVTNAAVIEAPHGQGWEKEAPYDVIFVGGRLTARPDALLAQLKDLGRLVCVFGGEPMAAIRVWTRRGDAFSHVDAWDATAPLAPGFAPAEAAFAF